jgi:hypothetical protein
MVGRSFGRCLRSRLLSGTSMNQVQGFRAETKTVLRAVAKDFFFNCWCLEIPSDNSIRHVPMCVCYHAQGVRLETFQNFYVGSGSRTPEFYSVGPDWFEYCFIYDKFVVCREF